MKKICFILAIILLSACGEPTVEKPKKLIEEDTMVNIFYDLAIIDAMKSHSPEKLREAKNVKNYIYKKYAVDSLQFAQSNRYYASDIRKYKKMYKRVDDRLKRNQEIVDVRLGKKPAKNLPRQGTVK
jgi:hypothetical protein